MEKEYYISKEQFITLKNKWKEHNHHTAADIIIYNVLRSKPADNGFVARTKNIQSNDEWYAFHEALRDAIGDCSPGRKWDGGKYVIDTERYLERFKEHFGIAMPAGITDKLKEAKK